MEYPIFRIWLQIEDLVHSYRSQGLALINISYQRDENINYINVYIELNWVVWKFLNKHNKANVLNVGLVL